MCNFEKGKINYSKSQSITTYDDSKNKPLSYVKSNSFKRSYFNLKVSNKQNNKKVFLSWR